MYMQTPIVQPSDRPLEVLLYARYSTEEQDASSITDQYTFCSNFLELMGVEDVTFRKISDQEVSGEIISRPGIDTVRKIIENRECDLLMAEDSSRAYRNVAPCLELIGLAVDRNIRCIFINDNVDTADREHWEEELTDALNHHARSNRFTSRRIKRKHEGLWKLEAALGLVKPGYKRRPTVAASMGEPARGPFYDEVDEQWKPVICEAYERIQRDDPAWSVAHWLTAQGLSKCSNSLKKEWTAKNVNDLIRRPDYRGRQKYRVTISEKHHGSGKRKPKRNEDPSAVLERDMPHLQMVPEGLWFEANTAIDKRKNGKAPLRGIDHPLAGIPRDSRGPLSTIFFCGCCGGKMWMDGRGQGGYRCSQSSRKMNKACWNKASALRALTHKKICTAITNSLLHNAGLVDALLNFSRELVRNDGRIGETLSSAKAELGRKDRAGKNLIEAIEDLNESD